MLVFLAGGSVLAASGLCFVTGVFLAAMSYVERTPQVRAAAQEKARPGRSEASHFAEEHTSLAEEQVGQPADIVPTEKPWPRAPQAGTFHQNPPPEVANQAGEFQAKQAQK